MAKGPRYRHDACEYVISALDAMIEHLAHHLSITERVTHSMDTIEEFRKLDDLTGENTSEEELEKELQESRDRSIAELGHLQRRLDEVRELKRSLENRTPPPKEVVAKIYQAIIDSIVYETIRRHGFVLTPDKSAWGPERHAEDEHEHKRLHLYAQALMLGFGLMPQMSWHRFPFDTI